MGNNLHGGIKINTKILLLIAVIVGILISGCVDYGIYNVGKKYPIVNIETQEYPHQDQAKVTILVNGNIESIQIQMAKSSEEAKSNGWYLGKETGKIILDNESYLKIIWTDYNSSNFAAHSYSEIHIKRPEGYQEEGTQ